MVHLSSGCGARVGEEAVVTVDAESAESSRVGRGVSDCVEHLYILLLYNFNSRIKTFMSLMLWMYKASSRQTTSLALFNFTAKMVLL